MQVMAQHILISAIQYLDGSPTGYEGLSSVKERTQAIKIMFSNLPKSTQKQLEKERADFWR